MKNRFPFPPYLLFPALALLIYFSGFFVLLTPLPFLYGGFKFKHQFFTGVGASLLLGIAIYILFGPVLFKLDGVGATSELALFDIGLSMVQQRTIFQSFGIAYLAYYLLLSSILFASFSKGWSLILTGKNLILAIFCFTLVIAFIFSQVFPVSLTLFLKQYFLEIIQEVAKIQAQVGKNSIEAQIILKEAGSIASMMLATLPGWLFAFTLLVASINIWAFKTFFKGASKGVKLSILKIKLPFELIWVAIGAGIAFFLDQYIVGSRWLGVVAANIIIVLAVVYFLQGFGVLAFFLKKKSIFKWPVYLMALFFFHLSFLVLTGIGFADEWADFRKLNLPKKLSK